MTLPPDQSGSASRPPIDDCQLQSLQQAGTKPVTANKIRSMALRLITALERRIPRWRRSLGQPDFTLGPHMHTNLTPAVPETAALIPGDPGGAFETGELVEVLTYDEIKSTLDQNGTCEGLYFMEGMKPYCGRRLVIKKRVRTIFDERGWKMIRLRNAYILEGAICDGRGLYQKEGCDRCCFYFFKNRWLRRLTAA